MPYKSRRDELDENFAQAVDAGVEKVARTLVAEIQSNLNKRKSVKGQSSPSKPGQPPANQSGALMRSFSTKRVKRAMWAVGTKLKYAAIQEFGGVITPKNGKHLVFKINDNFVRVKRVTIPSRPYVRPALAKINKRAAGIIAETFEKFLN